MNKRLKPREQQAYLMAVLSAHDELALMKVHYKWHQEDRARALHKARHQRLVLELLRYAGPQKVIQTT